MRKIRFFKLASVLLVFTLFLLPNVSNAKDKYNFMDFSWDDNGETVKNKMGKNNFKIRRDSDTKNPDFEEVGVGGPTLAGFKKQINAIDAKLPSNLLFHVYAGMGPSDSPAFFGTFCISNAINKLTFYNIKVNSDHRDGIEGILIEKYGPPSSTDENYKLWEQDGEKLFLLRDREILYLNEVHLKSAISKMTFGVNDAKNKELQMVSGVFATQCGSDLCFHAIGWESKIEDFKQMMKGKHYFIREPKKIKFEYFPFDEDKMLDDFKKRANPTFIQDKKIISEFSGFNEDKSIPVSGVNFYFSSQTGNLLYYIVEIDRDFKKSLINSFDSSVGQSNDYVLGQYWNKNNIYVYSSSNKILYFNKKHVSEHVGLIEDEGKSEGANQQQKMKKMF
jgi:hypothetical protein